MTFSFVVNGAASFNIPEKTKMMTSLHSAFLALALSCLTLFQTLANAAPTPGGIDGLQHVGAVHLYAEPGPLTVTLWKRDSSGAPLDRALTAVLAGPEGKVYDRIQLIAPDGKLGQRVEGTLQAEVAYAGVYTLFLSANADQYLRLQTIGFSSNASQFMLNTGTGHTDTTREEPIVLNGPDAPFGIFFAPPRKAFKIRISRLPETTRAIEMYDAAGNLLRTFVATGGKAEASVEVPEGMPHGIWELRLPTQKGSVLIEGLNTAWSPQEKPLPVWTTSREQYFDLAETYWLIAPRRFARKTAAGEKGRVEFTVFNGTSTPMILALEVKSPAEWGKVSVPTPPFELAPGARRRVPVEYALPLDLQAGRYDFSLIAKNSKTGAETFSVLELRVAGSHETDPAITLPIQFQLFEHDQFQFAYEPDYSRLNQFYFDSANRPWQVTREGVQTLSNEAWKTVSLPVAAESGNQPVRYPGSTIGTDRMGKVYTVIDRGGANFLLRADARTLQGEEMPLPAGGKYTLETYQGGSPSAHPPVVLRYLVQKEKKQITFWSRPHRLEVFIPEVVDGKMQLGEPVLISDNCVGFSDHSGITSPVAADRDKLHFIWGETSDPEKNDPGVPTYTATYDRKTGLLSKAILLAYSPPVNDIHNMSTLLVDSSGERHAIMGAHGKPFQYLHAARGGEVWSKAEPISALGQTYVGAVLDAQDGIHLYCRTWRRGPEFPGVIDAALYYQHKPKGAPWDKARPFALAALPGYSVFYHRATVDRSGRLFLSLLYWPTWSAYRESYPNAAKQPLYFTSSDQGKTWALVTTPDLAAGIFKSK